MNKKGLLIGTSVLSGIFVFIFIGLIILIFGLGASNLFILSKYFKYIIGILLFVFVIKALRK